MIKIVESTGHGKACAGYKKTSTIQVREYSPNGDYLLQKQIRFTVGDVESKAKAFTKAAAYKAERLAETVKGFLGYKGRLIYYTDGRNVFRSDESNVADARTGFLIGRWECTVQHWQRYSLVVYGMERIPPDMVGKDIENNRLR